MVIAVSIAALEGKPVSLLGKHIKQTETNVKCPALAAEDGVISSGEYSFAHGYDHCKKCLSGVFIPHGNDEVHCTFCGALKETEK